MVVKNAGDGLEIEARGASGGVASCLASPICLPWLTFGASAPEGDTDKRVVVV